MDYGSASASERQYLPPAVAVSVVAFALRPPSEAVLGEAATDPASDATTLWIPLVRRTRAPFLGRWALPGGPTRWDETLTGTALRTVRGAALRAPGYLEQLYSFGSVERSADAQRLVTIAYWAMYGEQEIAADPEPRAGSTAQPRTDHAVHAQSSTQRRWDDPVDGSSGPFAGGPEDQGQERLPASGAEAPRGVGANPDPNVAWFSADRLPPLAFDHAEIVATALARLRSKTEYAAVAHRFLGPTFTLGRLRSVTEAVLGQSVDPANFRRQALTQGRLVETGDVETGSPYRPAKLYRFRDEPHDAVRPGSADRRGTSRTPPSQHTPTRSLP